jgi:CrcB protein
MMFLAIAIGAGFGALFRFSLGLMLNSIFPTIPLGTLMANLIGGFLMGLFMAFTRNHSYMPEIIKLMIATGFLGGLTTFSTFSAETVTLLANQEYLWSALIIFAHVAGSISLTIIGIYTVKLFTA